MQLQVGKKKKERGRENFGAVGLNNDLYKNLDNVHFFD